MPSKPRLKSAEPPDQTNVHLEEARSGHSGGKLQAGRSAERNVGHGSSLQGELQNAKGGPADANQGGASRGSSRLEPSHALSNPGHITGKKRQNRPAR